MTIIGIDGCQIIIRMPAWEYKQVAKALADLDDDDTKEN